MLCPPTSVPCISSISLIIASLYKLNKSDENTHPCLTPLSIAVKLQSSMSTLMHAVCSQYKLRRSNHRSLPSISKDCNICTSCISDRTLKKSSHSPLIQLPVSHFAWYMKFCTHIKRVFLRGQLHDLQWV